ncbi:MAG: sigma-70 family RNA polymerase sigma factor [Pseudomonadota bacterium]
MDKDFSPAADMSLASPDQETRDDYDGAPRAVSYGALANLYSDYAAPLSASIRKAFGDGPPDPDDVTHQAFQKVMERDNLSAIANLKAFVWRTARNIVLNEKDREHTRSRFDYEVEQLFFASNGYGSSPETVISARQQITAINAVLDAMPAMRRRAFILHRIEGLTVADTARQMGISRPGASKHIARAVADIDAACAVATHKEA